MFATCMPFPLGAGGEAAAFAPAARVPGPSSLQFAFVRSVGNSHLCEMLPGPFGPGFGECVSGEAPCCPGERWVGWSVCAGGVAELLGQLRGVFPISCWCDVMVGLQCGNMPLPAFQGYCKRLVGRSCSEVGQAIKKVAKLKKNPKLYK